MTVPKRERLAIVGSRTFEDYAYLKAWLERFSDRHPILSIVSGGARGADSLASYYAKTHAIPMVVYKADWATHGKAAGFLRNSKIVEYCTMMVAFWDGKSNGTKDSISKARAAGRTVWITWPPEDETVRLLTIMDAGEE